MKNSVLVTITGLAHYYGTKPFKVGAVIKLMHRAVTLNIITPEHNCRISVQSVTSQTVHIRFIRVHTVRDVYMIK